MIIIQVSMIIIIVLIIMMIMMASMYGVSRLITQRGANIEPQISD